MAAHPREEVWPPEAMRGSEVCEVEVWVGDPSAAAGGGAATAAGGGGGGGGYDDDEHDKNEDRFEKQSTKTENGKDQGKAKTSRDDMMMMDFVMDKLQSMGLEMEEQGVEYLVERISTLDIGEVCGMEEGLAERLGESCGLD